MRPPERHAPREERLEEDGNLVVALLLAPMLAAICMALWALGRLDYSEAWAWGIVVLALCRWLGKAEG